MPPLGLSKLLTGLSLSVLLLTNGFDRPSAQAQDITPAVPTFAADPAGDSPHFINTHGDASPIRVAAAPHGMQPRGYLWKGFDPDVEYDIYGFRRMQNGYHHAHPAYPPVQGYNSSGCYSNPCPTECEPSVQTILPPCPRSGSLLGTLLNHYRCNCVGSCTCSECEAGRSNDDREPDEVTPELADPPVDNHAPYDSENTDETTPVPPVQTDGKDDTSSLPDNLLPEIGDQGHDDENEPTDADDVEITIEDPVQNIPIVEPINDVPPQQRVIDLPMNELPQDVLYDADPMPEAVAVPSVEEEDEVPAPPEPTLDLPSITTPQPNNKNRLPKNKLPGEEEAQSSARRSQTQQTLSAIKRDIEF